MLGRKNVIIEIDDKNTLPNYRYYGKRGSAFLEAVAVWTTTVFFCGFILIYFFIAFMTLRGIYSYIGVLIPTTVTAILLSILLYFLFRGIYKRIIFILKLKKVCKRKDYRLKTNIGFLASFKYSQERYHLTVDTPQIRFLVKYLPTYRYNSELIFQSAEALSQRVNKNAHKSVLKTALGIKEKYKLRQFSFSDIRETSSKRTERIVLMNPVPREAYAIKNQVKEPVGSRDRIFGYTLYNGSDFISELEK